MKWEDEGYLLSKSKFGENANIVNIFTSQYGKKSGIVYGGTSRKVRNFLQIANKIFILYNSKDENRLGYFKTELIDPISPKFFSDKERTAGLLSATSLLNILLPDSQPNMNIYNSFSKFLSNIDQENWIYIYIFWEFNLIKELGYGLDLEKLDLANYDKKEIIDFKIDNLSYRLPVFLIKKTIPEIISKEIVVSSLSFTRNLLQNKFFMSNNLKFPNSRVFLENYFK